MRLVCRFGGREYVTRGNWTHWVTLDIEASFVGSLRHLGIIVLRAIQQQMGLTVMLSGSYAVSRTSLCKHINDHHVHWVWSVPQACMAYDKLPFGFGCVTL